MKQIIIGHHKKAYIIELYRWAKRLEAEEMTVWSNGSVTLMCKDGCICDEYTPSNYELNPRRRTQA